MGGSHSDLKQAAPAMLPLVFQCHLGGFHWGGGERERETRWERKRRITERQTEGEKEGGRREGKDGHMVNNEKWVGPTLQDAITMQV